MPRPRLPRRGDTRTGDHTGDHTGDTRTDDSHRTEVSPPVTVGEIGILLRAIFARLLRRYGPQNWWPARTPTEVVVGAILTQNTAWMNVERAIGNLRRARRLTWSRLRGLGRDELAELIRPAGTYRVKAARLSAFVEEVTDRHGGSLERLLAGDLEAARQRLLGVHGIGRETADAILLYAGGRPTFVVDAYTQRVLRRHGLVGRAGRYEEVRRLFHDALPADARLFGEYHALLVAVAKAHCRATARCDGCPLRDVPHDPAL
jgi:endonuclease-3 related protein